MRRSAEQFRESSAILLIAKNRLARVTSRAEMIDGIFKLYPQRPRHSCLTAGTFANVECLDLTFSSRIILFPPGLAVVSGMVASDAAAESGVAAESSAALVLRWEKQ